MGLRTACATGPGHLVSLPTHVPKGDATWVWVGRRGHCVPRVEKQPELLAGNSGHRGQGPAGIPPQGPSACCQWGGAVQMTLERLGRDWNLLPVSHQGHSLILSLCSMPRLCPDIG